VLVEIETEGGPATVKKSEDEQPLADGAEKPTPEQKKAIPTTATEPVRAERKAEPEVEVREAPTSEKRPSTSLGTNGGAEGKVLASPAVRQRGRDLGIDLGQVKTSGDRVRHADLDAYLLYNGGSVSGRGSAPRADETIKVVGLRRKIAENMQEAKRRIPHFALVEQFDVTDLEDTRAMMNRDRGSNPKLTILPFLITALSKAMSDWPMLNATYDDDANVVTRHGAVHMGVATQTDGGLMVPVIRNAEGMSVWQLAREVLRLSEAARTGKASREELTGPTFTISSLGPMGGIASTPVINPPQVATIAVNKLQEIPVIVDGELEARKVMNLSLSCDHRVVDGWDAASFLQTLKGYIENPLRLLSA
jgi:2-oxoisovalerate dehydrogenase E2 component (dihydrolipoyl transacylase)